jgi:hypothetical protein
VPVNVPSDEARSVALLRLPRLAPGSYCLSLQLRDAQGQFLGRNEFEFAIMSEEP